ncbi:hypothetical protein [Halobacillus sp. H74]|uniref:hypothetical protein n=1 Tax=Halobacillus sp. H74 TaxID=3457436 RepID=UPI003FCDFB17
MFRQRLVFIQSVSIFLYLLVISYVNVKFQEHAVATFSPYPYFVFGQLAYVPVGMVLALQQFFHFLRGEGKVRLRKSVWILMILPALYLLLVPFFLPINTFLPMFLVTNIAVAPVLQVVLGYGLIISFYKK